MPTGAALATDNGDCPCADAVAVAPETAWRGAELGARGGAR